MLDWEIAQFGKQDNHDLKMGLGMGEEVGETQHYLLKRNQKIREGTTSDCVKEIADGVIDTMVYGIQLLSELGLDAEEQFNKVVDEVVKRDWKNNPKGGNISVQSEKKGIKADCIIIDDIDKKEA